MELLICVWITILGAVMGSFLGCMGYRIPNKIKTTYPSSFCGICEKQLKWYMNVPILSYLFLRGRCAYCKSKIGIIYFICEVLGALLFLGSFLLFGPSKDFLIAIVFICMFIVTIVSDFLYYYISDRVLIIGSICLITINYFFLSMDNFLNLILAAIIVFALMYGIKLLGNYMFRCESLGDGDIKLMAVITLGLGLLNSVIALFFAACTALIFTFFTYKRFKDGLIPFGPFLLIGCLIMVFAQSYITPYIIDLFAL